MPLVNSISRLKDPRYTGHRRCMPCTTVNLALLCLADGVVLIAGYPLIAVVVVIVGVVVLYFKGYLVPGTPTLTKRYLPDSVLAVFDHGLGEPRRTAGRSREAQPIDMEAVLLDVGVLREADNGELERTEGFRTKYRDRLADLRQAPDDHVVDAVTERGDFPADPAEVSLDRLGDTTMLTADSAPLATWPSYAAFLGDAAAADVLSEWDPAWSDRSLESRGRLLRGVRIWTEYCPHCGGDVTLDTEPVQSCCREIEIAAATCEHCGSRVCEIELPEPIDDPSERDLS